MTTSVRRNAVAIILTLIIVLGSVPTAAVGTMVTGDNTSSQAYSATDPSFTEATDNVSVWNGSAFSLRASSTDATTTLDLPLITVTDTNSDGESLLNKDLNVYQVGQQFGISFRDTSAINTTQFDGNNVELLVARATPEDGSTSELTIGETQDLVTNLSEDSVNRNFTFISEPEKEVTDGEVTFNFTPQSSGQYVFILTRNASSTSIDGDGNLTVDGDVQVLGFDTAPVRDQAGSVTPNETTIQPGDDISVDLQSELDSSQISHGVLLVDESAFRNGEFTVETSGSLTSLSGDDVTITRTIEGFNGVSRVEDGTTVLGTELGARESTGLLTLSGAFEFIANETSGDGPTDNVESDAVEVDASAVVVSSGQNTTVTVESLSNFSLGEYKLLYVASTENGQNFTTANETVSIKQEVQLNIRTVTNTPVRRGNSVTFEVTDAGGQAIQGATVQFAGQTGTTGANGRVTLSAQQTGSVTATTTKAENSTAVFLDGTTTVQVNSPPPRIPDDDDPEPPTPDEPEEPEEPEGPQVNPTDRGAEVTIEEIGPGATVNVTLPNNTVANGSGVSELDLTSDNGTSNVSVEVTRPQDSPTENAPGLERDAPTARAVSYFSINASTTDRNIRGGITFTLNNSSLGPDQSPEDVNLYRFNNSQWNELETTHLGGDRYRAQTEDGFSPFAIGVQEEEELAAEFEVTAVEVDTRSITTEETTTVTATVTNTGNTEGSFDVELTVGGEVVQTETVQLAAGESQEVTFDIGFDESGLKQIEVSDVDAGVIVVDAVATPTPTPTPTPTATEPEEITPSPTPAETSTTFPGFTSALAVLALLGAALLLARRHN